MKRAAIQQVAVRAANDNDDDDDSACDENVVAADVAAQSSLDCDIDNGTTAEEGAVSSKEKKRKIITTELGDNDVVPHQVAGASQHAGTLQYRALVMAAAASYKIAKPYSHERKCIANGVIDSIYATKGRFLAPIDASTTSATQWELLSRADAHRKTCVGMTKRAPYKMAAIASVHRARGKTAVPPSRAAALKDDATDVLEDDNHLSLSESEDEEREITTTKLRDNDVVAGRVAGACKHPGNVTLRAMVLKAAASYNKAKAQSSERKRIGDDILDHIYAEKGRFLSPIDIGSVHAKQWELMSRAKAHSKIGMALNRNIRSTMNKRTSSVQRRVHAQTALSLSGAAAAWNDDDDSYTERKVAAYALDDDATTVFEDDDDGDGTDQSSLPCDSNSDEKVAASAASTLDGVDDDDATKVFEGDQQSVSSSSKSEEEKPENITTELRGNHVVAGCFAGVPKLPGNVRFRAMMSQAAASYKEAKANSSECRRIVEGLIVDSIYAQKGRFVSSPIDVSSINAEQWELLTRACPYRKTSKAMGNEIASTKATPAAAAAGSTKTPTRAAANRNFSTTAENRGNGAVAAAASLLGLSGSNANASGRPWTWTNNVQAPITARCQEAGNVGQAPLPVHEAIAVSVSTTTATTSSAVDSGLAKTSCFSAKTVNHGPKSSHLKRRKLPLSGSRPKLPKGITS